MKVIIQLFILSVNYFLIINGIFKANLLLLSFQGDELHADVHAELKNRTKVDRDSENDEPNIMCVETCSEEEAKESLLSLVLAEYHGAIKVSEKEAKRRYAYFGIAYPSHKELVTLSKRPKSKAEIAFKKSAMQSVYKILKHLKENKMDYFRKKRDNDRFVKETTNEYENLHNAMIRNMWNAKADDYKERNKLYQEGMREKQIKKKMKVKELSVVITKLKQKNIDAFINGSQQSQESTAKKPSKKKNQLKKKSSFLDEQKDQQQEDKISDDDEGQLVIDESNNTESLNSMRAVNDDIKILNDEILGLQIKINKERNQCRLLIIDLQTKIVNVNWQRTQPDISDSKRDHWAKIGNELTLQIQDKEKGSKKYIDGMNALIEAKKTAIAKNQKIIEHLSLSLTRDSLNLDDNDDSTSSPLHPKKQQLNRFNQSMICGEENQIEDIRVDGKNAQTATPTDAAPPSPSPRAKSVSPFKNMFSSGNNFNDI